MCPGGTETLPKPRAGDAWLLRYILHDWSDGDAARILAALRAAMGTTKVTLCIVEVFFSSKLSDLGNKEQADAACSCLKAHVSCVWIYLMHIKT